MGIFSTLAALQIYQKNGQAHFEDNVSKNVPKHHAKNREKLRKSGSGGCFGRSGGLPGAMSSRLGRRSAKMHTRSRKIGPTWWHLGGQVGAKISKKSIENLLIFWLFFEALLEAKMAPKSLQNGSRNRLQDAFQGAWKRSGESVISNNAPAF